MTGKATEITAQTTHRTRSVKALPPLCWFRHVTARGSVTADAHRNRRLRKRAAPVTALALERSLPLPYLLSLLALSSACGMTGQLSPDHTWHPRWQGGLTNRVPGLFIFLSSLIQREGIPFTQQAHMLWSHKKDKGTLQLFNYLNSN